MPVIRWCFAIGLLLFFATAQSAIAASETQLIIRTPELGPHVTFDAKTKAWLSGKPVIRAAYWERTRPPLQMGYEAGEFEGVTADVLGLLQQMLGVPISVLRYQDRNDALVAMANGEVDMLALSDLSDEENPLIKASKPYMLNRKVMVRRLSDSRQSSANVDGQRLAYITTSDADTRQLHKQYPQSTLVPYNFHINAIAGLAYNQSDAFSTDLVTAEFLTSRFHRNEVYIDDKAVPGSEADINFAVSARQPELLDAINESLAAIPVASMLRITSRWGLNDNVVVARTSLNLSLKQIAWINTHPTVRVGVSKSYAPLTFFDENDEFKGLTAELLKKIEQSTGLTFKIVRVNSVNDMTSQLQDQDVDLIAALSTGDHSLDKFQITRPYLVSPFVVITRRSEAGIRSLDELHGLSLALPWGNPLLSWLQQQYPKIKEVTVRNATQGIEMLSDGEVEGAVSSEFIADYFITHHFQSDLQIAAVIGPRPATIAMAVGPQDEILRDILNAAIIAIPPEELKEMTDRWRNNPAPAMANPWNTYKGVIAQVVVGAALLMLLFLIWNYYLRSQIQKRQKAERDLEDQLQFSRTLIDGSPVALYVRDREGRLAQCNQAYLTFFNASREELIGKTLVESQVFSAEFNAHYHQVYLDMLEHGEPTLKDMDVEVRGERYRVFHWMLPFHNFSGQYIGVIGGWLDITEREHLIEQLSIAKESAIDASRSKSVFLASMSHEIRTPVSALVGLIELLKMKGGSQAEIDESLEVAHQSAQTLLSLIGDILDLSKIEAGEMTPVPRPTHLGDMARSIYRLFETNALKKDLEFRLVCEIQHNGVMIDALMLNQVVANLLSNAIKFTEQGSVHLLFRELPVEEASPGRAKFAIQVSDTGQGLSETQRQEIFEPFVQADPQANRATGTGLGLSICASLAKLLGAQLNVDSQCGLGSRFTLIFEADLADVDQTPEAVTAVSLSSHKLRILVVEDHAPNRLLLCRQLEYLGHEAVPCDHGEAALAVWRNAEPPFDLTITDCNMPRMDGYQLTRLMREFEQQNALRMHPIFGLTANAQSEVTERCLAAGMTRCLFKPVAIEALALVVSEVEQVSKRRAQAAAATGSELDKIKLLSPESYGPLVQEIVLTHRQDSLELERLARDGDRSGLVRVAHKVRGGAQLAGDRALSEACHALEDRVVEEDESMPYSVEVEVVVACLHALEKRLLQDLP